jgi:hypothetical protein
LLGTGGQPDAGATGLDADTRDVARLTERHRAERTNGEGGGGVRSRS